MPSSSKWIGGNIARRKLLEKMMSNFVLGNTNARALCEEGETCEKLLYVGVGDVRNVLLTAQRQNHVTDLELVLNDGSPLTLARDVLLLDIGVKNWKSSVAIWSDALLSKESFKQLLESLNRLLSISESGTVSEVMISKWISTNRESLEAMKKHWKAWREACETQKDESASKVLANKRKKILLSTKNAGHGRTGASESWLSNGVSSVEEKRIGDLNHSNPTLFDLTDENEQRLVDFQGPFATFCELEGKRAGEKEFAKQLLTCWNPLYSALSERVQSGKILVKIRLGDCMNVLEEEEFRNYFDAIDTSNVMDYVGLWNLLLVSERCLKNKPGAFIFTEQIMGVSNNLEELLEELPPRDPEKSKVISHFLGLSPQSVPKSLSPKGEEKVVHLRWCRHSTSDLDWDVSDSNREVRKSSLRWIEKAIGKVGMTKHGERLSKLWAQELEEMAKLCEEGMKAKVPRMEVAREVIRAIKRTERASMENSFSLNEETAQFQSLLFAFLQSVCLPSPMNPDMINDIELVVEASYSMPFGTLGTFLRMLIRIAQTNPGRKLANGVLNVLISNPEYSNFPHVRNRMLALKTLCTLNQENLLEFGVVRDNETAFIGAVSSYSVEVNPLHDLYTSRGGILEPALAAVFFSSRTVEAQLINKDTKWINKVSPRDGSETPTNQIHDFISKCSGSKIQIFDNLTFDGDSNLVSLFLPDRLFESTASKNEESSSESEDDGRMVSMILIDVQQFRVLTEPVELTKFSKLTEEPKKTASTHSAPASPGRKSTSSKKRKGQQNSTQEPKNKKDKSKSS